MKASFFSLLFSFFPAVFFSQTLITGTVTDEKETPLVGANAYLEGTYDGASTDEWGQFSFETSETGIKKLMVSFLSYDSYELTKDVSALRDLKIVLKEDVNSLETVTLSAGTFSAGDNSKISVLKPLDIVTTASARGDFIGALQTLPGTTTVAEDGRLFVRGGDANETQIFIDGIRVFSPYVPSANNVPTRGRYSPFLFDGITFSTGGYSAEYGQALSSVLLLNTIDEPPQTKTDISILSVGGGLGHTQKWNKNSLSLNTAYFNLAPYHAIFPDRNNWKKPYEAVSSEVVFRQKMGEGLLKAYSAFEGSFFKVIQDDINHPTGIDFELDNKNIYSNLSFSQMFDNGWNVFAGGSFSYERKKIAINLLHMDDTENAAHFKWKIGKRINSRIRINFGAEQFISNFKEIYNEEDSRGNLGFNNNVTAAFAEADIIFSRKFALKTGIRGEYVQLTDKSMVSPRVSFAYKTGSNSQLSVAYGDFYQQQEREYLKFDADLLPQHAQHYILNYQYNAHNRIFRAEAYRKVYNHLISYSDSIPGASTSFGENGNGYAQGIDFFWRDNESIKNFDYWISYSYLDTQRKYKNFPTAATPSFANKHNLSVVGKWWIEDLKSQLGLSYQFGSGRAYTDYNEPGFLQKKTKSYNNISLNWAYLISPQKILYVAVENVFNFKNEFGYQYASLPNSQGNFARRKLRPAADQFLVIGFFWTISQSGKDNQLKNL